MRRPILIAVSVVVAGLGIVGFLKGRNRVDTADADAKVKDWAESNIGPVEKVTCPEAKLTKGNHFECAVAFTGAATYQARIDVLDDDGKVEYSWPTPIAGGELLAKNIVAAVKQQQGKDITLDCGKGVVAIPADGLMCTAKLGENSGHLRVKSDGKSGVTWNVEN